MIPSSWEGAHYALSIFGTDPTAKIDAKNIAQSISQIIDYIRNNLIDKKAPTREFEHVTKGFWSLIQAIYSLRWDFLPIEDGKNFCDLVGGKILNNYAKLGLVKQPEASKPQPSISDIMPKPTIPTPSPPIKTMESNNKKASKPSTMKKSYVQASKVIKLTNIEDVIRVKEAFPALSANEVRKMLKIKNSNGGTKKHKINMTTRG